MIVSGQDGGCTVVRINRAEKANALTGAMLTDLRQAIAAARTPALILTGEGKVFSAGADLDEMKQTLLKGESVKIRGFGTFRVADKKGGMVRDFLNNTMKSSPGGRRIRFRLSPLLRSIHELHR